MVGMTGTENGNAVRLEDGELRESIEKAAGDALAESLDEMHGGQVTDKEVFRCCPCCSISLSPQQLHSVNGRPGSTVYLYTPFSDKEVNILKHR